MVTKSNGAKGKQFCPYGYVKKCYDLIDKCNTFLSLIFLESEIKH